MDLDERIVASECIGEDTDTEIGLRPKTLSEYI